MKIVTTLVIVIALISTVTASYNKSSAHSSTVLYSELDSSETTSSEIASNYSAPARYASEEDKFQADEEKENEIEAEYEIQTETAKNKEPEYTTASVIASSTPAFVVAPSVIYFAPDEAVSTTTIAVPVYRSPAVLPYWLRSQYSDRSPSVKKTTTFSQY